MFKKNALYCVILNDLLNGSILILIKAKKQKMP